MVGEKISYPRHHHHPPSEEMQVVPGVDTCSAQRPASHAAQCCNILVAAAVAVAVDTWVVAVEHTVVAVVVEMESTVVVKVDIADVEGGKPVVGYTAEVGREELLPLYGRCCRVSIELSYD